MKNEKCRDVACRVRWGGALAHPLLQASIHFLPSPLKGRCWGWGLNNLGCTRHCSSKLGSAFGWHKIWIILAAPQHCSSKLDTAFGWHKIWIILAAPQHSSSKLGTAFGLHKIWATTKAIIILYLAGFLPPLTGLG